MIEPSNDERSNLPDATRGYIHDLEQERDALRKELAEARRQVKLVEPMLEWTNCEVCPARGQSCEETRDDATCGELILAWAAQQAKDCVK